MLTMKASLVALGLALTAAASAGDAVTAPAPPAATQTAEDSLGTDIFHNEHLTAYLLELPPQQATSMSRREADSIDVFISGQTTSTSPGRPPQAEPAGETRFRPVGFTDSVRNEGSSASRTVILMLARPQGYAISEEVPARRYCNEGNKLACVEEKHLFCTTHLCAEDVKMGPGATRGGFAADADQMLVAVTDYQLTDAAAGKPPSVHTRPAGQVEWIPAGAANRWTNTGTTPTHFVLIRFGATF